MTQLKLSQVYCIDASSLFDLKRWYPKSMITFVPIWDKIESLIRNDILISHVEVLREIKQGNDELIKWANTNRKMFKDSDNLEQILNFEKIKRKYEPQYWENETRGDRPWGDPWIIALSMTIRAIIVTDENKTKPNRIPTIAQQFGINSLNLLEFFKQIGIK